MASLTIANRAGEHLLDELRNLSSDPIILAAGQNLVAGSVLGRVTSSGSYAIFDPSALDGTAVAAGVLFDAVDASSGDRPAVAHTFGCAVVRDRLAWKGGLTDPQKADGLADLLRLGIKAR